VRSAATAEQSTVIIIVARLLPAAQLVIMVPESPVIAIVVLLLPTALSVITTMESPVMTAMQKLPVV
jgi:hypothetical protein